jgi:hypothetical protein
MAFPPKTCVEVQCDECGYFFDEDGDGRRHFDTKKDAVEELNRYGWQEIADALYCDGDDCQEAARKVKTSLDVAGEQIPGQLDLIDDKAVA